MRRRARNLKNKCWDWFSKAWHLEHKGERCVLCGNPNIQLGHVIPKCRGLIYWFLKADIFPQCAGCNLRHNFDPTDYTSWFIKKFGQERYDRLAALKNRPKPYIDFLGRVGRYKKCSTK